MNINQILNQLDHLFKSQQIEKVEKFLLDNIHEAKCECNQGILITLLNELIGYYRDVTEYDKSINVCKEAMELLNSLSLQGTIPYATTLQNVANALRAAGQLEASKKYYDQVFRIYEEQLDNEDMRYASLYNNLSLLYQEMGEFKLSCEELEAALCIVKKKEGARIEVATTHANIALSLLQLEEISSAKEHLIEAFKIYNLDIQKNHHYSAALAAMGDVCFREENYHEAAFYYKNSMKELESNVGKTKSYEMQEEKYQLCVERLGVDQEYDFDYKNGLDLCKQFYNQHGEGKLKSEFPKLFERMSIGLVGNGSDAHGFDDIYSRDHDWGPGFCIWLAAKDYEKYYAEVEELYESLPVIFKGVIRNATPQGSGRLGVHSVHEFYDTVLEGKSIKPGGISWNKIREYNLYAATNGEVFKKGCTIFDDIRKELKMYYPDEQYILNLAKGAHNMSQSGQYNFARMLKRGDYVSASLMFSQFVESTMDVCYLLNRKYAPYTKWKFKGMEEFTKLMDVKTYLEIIVEQGMQSPKSQDIIEIISERILEELVVEGYTTHGSDFLEHHLENILSSIEKRELVESHTNIDVKKKREYPIENGDNMKLPPQISKEKNALVNAIVKMEWKEFDKVENTGGCRADCQDNWETFYVMRKSQFLAWPEGLLYSYQKDFLQANIAGWNMVTEKYGRMMISTDPEEYKLLEPNFPHISDEKLAIIEAICKIQVSWMVEFAKDYPNVTKGARNIHTSEDSVFATSYETYLRGELKTYSDKTFKLYGEFITKLAKLGENLAYNIIRNTALLYGCETVKEFDELMDSPR